MIGGVRTDIPRISAEGRAQGEIASGALVLINWLNQASYNNFVIEWIVGAIYALYNN